MPTKFLVALAPLVLVLGACGGKEDTSSSDTAAGTVSDIPQLTWDGSTCAYEGPQEVTAGVVTVELVNDSDGRSNVGVARLGEGKTAQDVFDYYGTEPSRQLTETSKPVPGWFLDMGGQGPAAAGETMRWESGLAAGQYFLVCTTRTRGLFALGTGLTVVNG